MFNQKKYQKEYRKQHKEYFTEYGKQWRKDNSGHIKEYCRENEKYFTEYMEQWRLDHPEYSKEYDQRNKINRNLRCRGRRKIDLKYNLNSKMATAIGFSLRGNKAGRYWEDLVGYTFKDLFKRLKRTMPKGYNWEDFLKGKLHIDHIIPKSAFNFTKSEHTDFQRCWDLNNLQLLPAEENIEKSNKLTKPFQPALQM